MLPAVGVIEGRVAFYNEVADITVDGERLDRPVTLFNEQLAARSSAGGGTLPPPAAQDRV